MITILDTLRKAKNHLPIPVFQNLTIKKTLAFFFFCSGLCYAQTPTPTPEFTFLHLTDIHLSHDGKSSYDYSTERLRNLIREINSEKSFPLPDFAVIAGDIADVVPYTPYRSKQDLLFAKKLLDSLRMPYFPGIGNHENYWNEWDPEYDSVFDSVFHRSSNYTFSFRNCLFVMFNNTGGFLIGPHQATAIKRNAWLDSVLADNKDKQIILTMHISPQKQRGNTPDWAWYSADTELGKVIERHYRNVLAVLSGHIHLNSRVEYQGITFICTSALASYPNQYKRFCVYRDSIVVQTFSTFPRNRSLWTGWSDSIRTNDTLYTLGLTTERDFTIDLNSWRQKNGGEIPKAFFLYQNYPNPFNRTTHLNFDVPKETNVAIELYDILGREVIRAYEGVSQPGKHTIPLDMGPFASGVYNLRMRSKDYVLSMKLIYLK